MLNDCVEGTEPSEETDKKSRSHLAILSRRGEWSAMWNAAES